MKEEITSSNPTQITEKTHFYENKNLFSLLFSGCIFGICIRCKAKIVILHTNDTHSQVEPSESNNMGGFARRMGEIDKIRPEEANVLLFDTVISRREVRISIFSTEELKPKP